MKIIKIIIVALLLTACQKETQFTGTEIINKAIDAAGGKRFDHFNIDFDFRKVHYKAKRNFGNYELLRIKKDSVNTTTDILSNSGLKRLINGVDINLPDSITQKIAPSVNSVHYFSLLPYGLNAPAVNKNYLEQVRIKGKTYYKVKITFSEDGGGEDFDDVFIYWVNTKTNKVDYLAYSYAEAHGLGLRFREAYNERIINGIRVVDYNNYKPKNPKIKLFNLDKAFENNETKLLSKIELENVKIEVL